MSAALADSALLNVAEAGSRRTRRFVPPTVTSLMPEPEQEAARAAAAAHASGLSEGHARGWAEGREAGFREGELQARRDYASRIAAMDEELAQARAEGAVTDGLRRLLAGRDADRIALEAACRAAMAAALGRLFPTLLARDLVREVATLLAEALAARPAERLEVRAHPDTPAASLLRELAAREPGRLALGFDATIGPAAVELRWAEGGLIADWETLLARVVAVLDGGETDANPDANRVEEKAAT